MLGTASHIVPPRLDIVGRRHDWLPDTAMTAISSGFQETVVHQQLEQYCVKFVVESRVVPEFVSK
jgi:hypothetical protein